MDVQIIPTKLTGHITLPASKSHCHRLLIASCLAGSLKFAKKTIFADTTTRPGNDISATIEALEQLEANQYPIIHCKESGSTLRFLLPVAAALKNQSAFYGQGRLPSRPLTPLLQQLKTHGCSITGNPAPENNNRPSLKTQTSILICNHQGKLQGGEFFLPGDISSQFVTGLLFALPLTTSGGSIRLTTPMESGRYVDLTVKVLRDFGITIRESADNQGLRIYRIPKNQHYRFPSDTSLLQPEPDWSAAAFWHVANELGCQITLHEDSTSSNTVIPAAASWLQGDSAIAKISGHISTIETIDASDIPDLVPAIAVLMALTPGKRRIIHAHRLRFKESDRLNATAAGLSALGAAVTEKNDGLVIIGKKQLHGGVVNGNADHRIVMAMSIAAIRCKYPVVIQGAQAVSKSYPLFFRHYRNLGGHIKIL